MTGIKVNEASPDKKHQHCKICNVKALQIICVIYTLKEKLLKLIQSFYMTCYIGQLKSSTGKYY